MLCSSCSEVVKPIVAVDIDGTLADYFSHFHSFAESWLDRPMSGRPYTGGYPYWEWFTNAFDCDRATFRAIKLAYRQGGMKRTQPPLRGAGEFMRHITKTGAEVWLTTTRPHDRFDRVDPDTREWLRRHGIPFSGLLYDRDKYGVLAERVDGSRVAAVVDDLPEQCERAAEEFGRDVPIMARGPQNSSVTFVRFATAPSLELAYGMIEERIIKWRERHE